MRRKVKNTKRLLQPRIHQQGEEQGRQGQVDMAKISLIIVLISIICHSIKWIPNIYEMVWVSRLKAIPIQLHF